MLRSLFIATLLLLPAPSFSAAYLYLYGIEGESTSIRHFKWIEVESISFGAAKETNTPTQLLPLTLSKKLDKSSPKLFLHTANGRLITNGMVELYREDPSAARFLQLKLTDVLVSTIAQASSSGEVPYEFLSLNSKTIRWTYTEVNLDGSALRDISASWDQASQTGSGGTIVLDDDNDGLPDDFERLHNLKLGFPDANDDADKDGMTNIEEFRAGTAPNTPNSIFQLTGARSVTGDTSLSWEPAPGKTYRLMGATSPDKPFEFIRFLTEAEAAAGQITLPPSGSFAFFILEVE